LKIFEMSDWEKCKYIQDGLKMGQAVSEEVFEDLLNSVPPRVYIRGYYFQPGEEVDFKNGRFVYMTFVVKNRQWVYKGLHGVNEGK
jgi:hypothetical protein